MQEESDPVEPQESAQPPFFERFRAKITQLEHSNAFWIFASVLMVLAVVSRTLYLADKPYHHDESLHGYYSDRVAQGFVHEYSALLHGPFLYYFSGAFMFLFGTGDFSARMPAALFGILLVAAPLLVRKLTGNVVCLVLMCLALISPTFWYFGRFMREDAFVQIWVVGIVFGTALYWKTKQVWSAYFATLMLAFHFVNKENSYLHTALWLLALGCIVFSERLAFSKPTHELAAGELPQSPQGTDRIYFILNCVSIFVTVFVLFYSSFFRHSKGSLNGIVDGLYRESLLYWWDQNQKRRIDGPFDYHLPILANYEFFLLPFLATGWLRLISLSRAAQKNVSFALTKDKPARIWLGSLAALVLAAFCLPRIAFVQEACEFTAVCLHTSFPGVASFATEFAKPLHISHSRHFLQILTYVLFGGTAFFCALHVQRKADAFLWFWMTGALGVYSYVGEKVPWLTIYILLPLWILAGLELGRMFSIRSLPLDNAHTQSAEINGELQNVSRSFSSKWIAFTLVWMILAVPFTVFKGARAAFPHAADPTERLVFTQTTPFVRMIRDRWQTMGKLIGDSKLKISMSGDSTWPLAWYALPYQVIDFNKPTPEAALTIDAFFLDLALLDEAKRNYPSFHIYSLPLRAWWVPGQNPSLTQIAQYFFTEKIYPRTSKSSATDNGFGSSDVLYLERANSGSPFAKVPRPEFLKLMAEATRP